MRHVLVDHYTFYERSVLESSPNFSINLDQFKVDVFSSEISNREDGIDSDGSEFLVGNGNATLSNDLNFILHFTTQRSLRSLQQVAGILVAEFDLSSVRSRKRLYLVCNTVQFGNSNLTSLFVTVRDSDRMYTSVQ